jgi:hypothetical protein
MEAYTLKAFSGDVSDLESARTEFQLFTYSFQHFLLRFLYIYLFFCLLEVISLPYLFTIPINLT